MRHADVIVVGAGVLGTFHAYFAAQQGYTTLLLERNAFPGDASTRNFGMIAQSIVPAGSDWAGYARDSAAIYRAMQQEYDIGVQQTGSLYLASTATERRVLEEYAASDWGEPCTFLNADEACYRYPVVQPSYCQGALLFPDDLTLEPRRLLRELIPSLAGAGLFEYVPLTPVTSVTRSGDGCVVADARGATYGADRVFVCSGSEYRTLFAGVLRRSGLRLCKLQMMQTVTQPAQTLPHAILSGLSIRRYPAFERCPSYRLLQHEAVEEPMQAFGIHVLCKQAADGGIVLGDSHQYSDLDAASVLEESSDPRIDDAIVAYGRRMLALPSWQLQRRWNGYYLAHGEQPIFRQTIDEAIHIATGIGGKGMTTGPGFARHNVATLLA